MLRAAARIMRADLAARPAQTALTALAVFAATAALVVTLALRAGLDDPFAEAKAATRGSDVAVERGRDVAALAKLPGVVAADIRPVAHGAAPVGESSVDIALEGLPAPSATLDRPKLSAGREPRAAGEALLERSFAREAGLKPGSALHVRGREGRSVDLRVVGIAVSTERGPYPHWTPALAWAPDAAVRALGGAGTVSRLAVKLADAEATDAYIAAVQRTRPGPGLGFVDWHDVRETITDQAHTNVIIIGVNTLLALLAVGFTIATIISGRILAQRREIGLLKAIGYTPRGVTAVLVAQYLAIGVVAGLAGLVAGAAIAPLLLRPMASLLATPTPSALEPGPLAAALGLILLAIALFTALPAARGGRLNTVEALAFGRAGGSGRASRAARLAAALRLPTAVRIGVKDAFAGRARAVLTVGALGMMVMTLVAGLSMEATYHRVIEDPALRAKPWDLRVDPGEYGEAEAMTLVRRQGASVARATTIDEFQVAVRGGNMQARAIGAGFGGFSYAVPDGRMFARPGEAIAGRGALERLGLKVGDPLTVRVGGVPVRLRIVGRHVEPDNDGQIVIFSRSSLSGAAAKRIGDASVIAKLAPGTDGRALRRTLQRESGNRVASELVSDEVVKERADVRPIVYGGNLLLVAIGLVNMVATLLLVTRERQRDFGILKAVGLTPRGVLAVVNAGAAVLGLIAIVLGIPVGIVVFRTLMALTSPSEGTDIVGTPGPLALALIVPFVLAVTALASTLPARRAAATSAARVLRAE